MSDPNSIADFTSWVTRHIDLDWTVDFEAKTISGTVSLLVQRLGGHDKLLLDASDLAIESVHLDGEPVEFSYDQTGGTFGGVLSITPPLMEDPECLQTVKYYITVCLPYRLELPTRPWSLVRHCNG